MVVRPPCRTLGSQFDSVVHAVGLLLVPVTYVNGGCGEDLLSFS